MPINTPEAGKPPEGRLTPPSPSQLAKILLTLLGQKLPKDTNSADDAEKRLQEQMGKDTD